MLDEKMYDLRGCFDPKKNGGGFLRAPDTPSLHITDNFAGVLNDTLAVPALSTMTARSVKYVQ